MMIVLVLPTWDVILTVVPLILNVVLRNAFTVYYVSSVLKLVVFYV